MNKMLSIIITITFLGCQRESIDFERSVYTIKNQKFEILTANKIFDLFVKGQSNYTSGVYRLVEQEFIGDAEFPFLLEIIKTEIEPDERMEKLLKAYQKIDFKRLVASTLPTIVDSLPGPDTKILFVPANPAYREFWESHDVALHAITPGCGKIIVMLNPTIENWHDMIPYALAHEYHHSVWISRNFERSDITLLEYLILEGRADAFAFELFPDKHHPFIEALNSEEESRIWKIIKPELHSRNSKFNELIMTGTSEIPVGSGYSIGYSIISSFKTNNPQINDYELIDMTPEDILVRSGYPE